MTQSAKTIAIVFRGIGNIGGTNNTIADHARSLTALGYRVDLIGEHLHRRNIDPEIGHPVSISKWRLGSRHKWRWFNWRVEQKLRSGNYDFIAGHGHNLRQDVLSLHNCLRLTHELTHSGALPSNDSLLALQENLLYSQRFRLCIANSRLMREDLVQRYGVPQDRIRIIYPGYDAGRFNTHGREQARAAVRQEFGLDNEFLIGLLTSGDFHKRGLDMLLDAFARLAPRVRSSSRLVIIAKRKALKSYFEQASRLGIAERIAVLPPSRSPERYLKALDICVHPARFEEFGQSVQEAMACGVPVAMSRRVGASELLSSQLRAALPARPCIRDIADRITAYFEDMNLRDAHASAGLEAVVDNTHAKNFSQTLATYREAGL